MVIIKDISNDIQCKIKNADRDIHKAIEKKNAYPNLANDYYDFSMVNIEQALSLHDDVVSIIEDYRKKNGEPPETMKTLWDWKHKEILEEMAEIKALQEFYKTL